MKTLNVVKTKATKHSHTGTRPHTPNSRVVPSGSQHSHSAHTSTRQEERRQETNRKIAQATMRIALSEGLKAVTIEEVSRQSGVAKTTIYRRFRNSDELLNSVSLLTALPAPELKNLAPTKSNLIRIIKDVVSYFDESVGVTSVGMILCSDSTFFRQIFDRILIPIQSLATSFFDAGKSTGIFKRNINVEFILDQVIGGMVANAAVHGRVEDSWSTQIVDFLWASIAE